MMVDPMLAPWPSMTAIRIKSTPLSRINPFPERYGVEPGSFPELDNTTLRLCKDESNRKKDSAGKRFPFFFGRNETRILNGLNRLLVKAEARALNYFDIDRAAP